MPAGTQRVLKQSALTLMLTGGGMGGKLSALQKVVFVGAQFSVEAVTASTKVTYKNGNRP